MNRPHERISRARLFALLLSSAVVLGLAGCPGGARDAGTDVDAGEDPNANLIPCESRDQCPDSTTWECVGVCLKLCANNDVCALDEYCTGGFCRRGCRDSDGCDVNADQICVAGTCVPRGNAATCGSKCDCAPGEVCADDICQSPPAQCASSADCARGPGAIEQCNAFACNGFTSQCFYPNAPPCVDATDCVGRPGCTGNACVCNAGGQCVVPSPCTPATEAIDCGLDAYCTAANVCDAYPACTNDSACTGIGMVCNLGLSRCERVVACTSNLDCPTSPSTYCNQTVVPAVCAIPSCLNGGTICGPNTVCNAGACVPDTTTGTNCLSHSQCLATEFCYFPAGQTEGVCQTGCASNASCPSGYSCNGSNQCVVTNPNNNPGGAGQSCSGTADCQFGLLCKLTGTCEETCGSPDSPCNPSVDANCCDLTGYQTCSPGLFFSFCTP
jgi:hypothetical protein